MAKPIATDAHAVKAQTGSSYPEPFDAPCTTRGYAALGDLFGLTDFGVALTVMPPGSWSSQRHWHSHEDEFIYVLEGRPTLITNEGRSELEPGMCAGFKAGVEDGHHLVNDSDAQVVVLVVGTRNPEDSCHYPDIDLHLKPAKEGGSFVHKDGSAYGE